MDQIYVALMFMAGSLVLTCITLFIRISTLNRRVTQLRDVNKSLSKLNYELSFAIGIKLDSANRWNALINCARIRPLGSAGLEIAEPNGYAHLGLEMWTHHQSTEKVVLGVDWLTRFADKCIAAQTTQRKREEADKNGNDETSS